MDRVRTDNSVGSLHLFWIISMIFHLFPHSFCECFPPAITMSIITVNSIQDGLTVHISFSSACEVNRSRKHFSQLRIFTPLRQNAKSHNPYFKSRVTSSLLSVRNPLPATVWKHCCCHFPCVAVVWMFAQYFRLLHFKRNTTELEIVLSFDSRL